MVNSTNISLLICVFVLIGLIKYGTAFDSYIFTYLKKWFKYDKYCELQQKILWLQFVSNGLRSGQTISEILIEYKNQSQINNILRTEIEKILNLQAVTQPISEVLQYSLKTGAPCLDRIVFYRKIVHEQLKLERRIKAQTAQTKAQCWLAAIIPWLLLYTFSWIDPDMIKQAQSEIWCWLLWIIGFSLDLLGFFWFQHLIKNTLLPQSKQQYENEVVLPDFLLYMIMKLSAGLSLEESIMQALTILPTNCSLKKIIPHLLEEKKYDFSSPILRNIHVLVQKSKRYGTAIKNELLTLLEDLMEQRQYHWEERVQILPTKTLLPLFTCTFTAAILIIISPLLPLLLNF